MPLKCLPSETTEMQSTSLEFFWTAITGCMALKN